MRDEREPDDATLPEAPRPASDAAPRGIHAREAAPALPFEARIEETARELAHLDEGLAGLFRMAHRLLSQIDEPGVAYLVAHAGRELSNVVRRALVPEMPELLDGEARQAAEDESLRDSVARFLGERPSHPLVGRWLEVHRTLQATAHVPDGARPQATLRPTKVRAAFLALSELLFGRVAPFFTAHADLAALAAVEHPTNVHLDRLRALLLRPVQRRRFYDKLAHPGWLELLRGDGMLVAPDVVVGSDGTARGRTWAEGEYLVRIAPAAPAAVRDVLLAIPRENRHPWVWQAVARAALALPAADARQLVSPLLRACHVPGVTYWSAHTLVSLAQRLADADLPESFALADGLLWTAKEPPPAEQPKETAPRAAAADAAPNETPGPEEPTEGAAGGRLSDDEPPRGDASPDATTGESTAAALRAYRRRRTDNTAWMLPRLEDHEFTRLLELAVPALERLDPGRTLEMLAQRLDRAVRLGVTADAEDDAGDAGGAVPDASDARPAAAGVEAAAPGEEESRGASNTSRQALPGRRGATRVAAERESSRGGDPFPPTLPDGSEYWAEWLDRPHRYGDVRPHLAAAVVGVAGRLASTDRDTAVWVDGLLRRYDWDVFARIRLTALTAAGAHAPVDTVDAIVRSPVALDPPRWLPSCARSSRGHRAQRRRTSSRG
jgi:hypothetical protein